MKAMELFADDVWIVTYPRSGTTWMQQIVRSIRCQGNEEILIDQAIPYLEAANSDFVPYKVDLAEVERPRTFKSHMPYNRMPCGLPKDTPYKYIYVARNPKDMVVSYFYHYFSTNCAVNSTSMNDAIFLMASLMSFFMSSYFRKSTLSSSLCSHQPRTCSK